jgi:cytochrome P450
MSEGRATYVELFGGSETSPVENPYPVFERLREESPLLPVLAMGRDAWLVTRFEDVRAILKNDELFSNRCNSRGIGIVMGRTIVEMDGSEHLKHRNIVTPHLAPRALKGDFPKTAEGIANELIDAFAARGSADLVAEFAFTYPLQVFTKLIGVPTEDHEAVHNWGIDLVHVATDPGRGLQAAAALADYLRPMVEKRKIERGDDLVSQLVHSEIDGERMNDDEVISFLRLLVLAGAETTYHLLGSTLYALLTHPAQLERVLSDRSRIRDALDEALRWESPVQLVMREATRDAQMGGVDIPAGSEIILCLGSANRDERQFPDPSRFDIDRENKEHIAFGFGKHYCAGSRLAYLEAEIAMNALFDRLPGLHLDPDEKCGVVGMAFRGPDRLPVRFDRA